MEMIWRLDGLSGMLHIFGAMPACGLPIYELGLFGHVLGECGYRHKREGPSLERLDWLKSS